MKPIVLAIVALAGLALTAGNAHAFHPRYYGPPVAVVPVYRPVVVPVYPVYRPIYRPVVVRPIFAPRPLFAPRVALYGW